MSVPPEDQGPVGPAVEHPEVDYRAVDGPFEHLTRSERRVAWAVLRSVTTALWAVVGCGLLALMWLSGGEEPRVLPARPAVLLVMLAVFAGVLEGKVYQLRDLPRRG